MNSVVAAIILYRSEKTLLVDEILEDAQKINLFVFNRPAFTILNFYGIKLKKN